MPEINDESHLKFGWRGEIFLGVGSYEGDVLCHDEENINLFTEANVAFGLKIKKEIIKNIDVNFSYFSTKLTGSDDLFTSAKGHQSRNFTFSNQIHELALGLVFEPLRHKSRIVSPYIFGSAGYAFGKSDTNYKINTKDQPFKVLINQDISESTSSTFALPLGIGLNFNIGTRFYLSLEGGLRFGLNDFVDGVSNSGNANIADYYGIGGLSLGYRFYDFNNKEATSN